MCACTKHMPKCLVKHLKESCGYYETSLPNTGSGDYPCIACGCYVYLDLLTDYSLQLFYPCLFFSSSFLLRLGQFSYIPSHILKCV